MSNDTDTTRKGNQSPEGAASETSSGTAAPNANHQVVILGGGSAGIAFGNRLSNLKTASVTIIEQSPHHFNQQAWMGVGTEGLEKEQTRRPEVEAIPPGVRLIFDAAKSIDPDAQLITTISGDRIHYDYVVVAVGVETRWDQIHGLRESLGSNGVCSVYGYEQAEATWEMIKAFEGGTAIFTTPPGPFKGGSAPLEVMHRAENYWTRKGIRDATQVICATAGSRDFGGDAFAEMLERDTEGDSFTVWPDHELIQVRGETKEAVFRIIDELTGSESVTSYDFLHVVPPMCAPDIVASSPLARQDEPLKGFLDVDHETFRHHRYPNIIGLGDVAGITSVKTSERARDQAERVADILRKELQE